jgi:polyphosphate glucokinase
VADVVERLKTALEADHVVIGGGNAKLLKKLPTGARLGGNNNSFRGGFRLSQKSDGRVWDKTKANRLQSGE